VLGVITYHFCANFAPQLGAALPSLALTFLLARITRGPVAARRQ
jgi:NCS1 family nucleobase:cation symporter-1